MFRILAIISPSIGGIMDQYEFITPVPPVCSDVECQCRALAYAAYHIDHVELRDVLLFTLIGKQYQLAEM